MCVDARPGDGVGGHDDGVGSEGVVLLFDFEVWDVVVGCLLHEMMAMDLIPKNGMVHTTNTLCCEQTTKERDAWRQSHIHMYRNPPHSCTGSDASLHLP